MLPFKHTCDFQLKICFMYLWSKSKIHTLVLKSIHCYSCFSCYFSFFALFSSSLKYSAHIFFMVRLDCCPICDGNVPSQKDARKQNVDQIYMDTNKSSSKLFSITFLSLLFISGLNDFCFLEVTFH
jgi:hypothetical protein